MISLNLNCFRQLFVVLFACAVTALAGCDSGDEQDTANTVDPEIEKMRPKVVHFCGACHVTPLPSSFPKDAWHHEVEQAYGFYYESGRRDLNPPNAKDVVAWYRKQAPEHLVLNPVKDEPYDKSRFRRQSVPLGEADTPTVSYIRSWTEPSSGRHELMFCNMSDGRVTRCGLDGRKPVIEELLRVRHTARTDPVDLDQNGEVDFLVSELGSYPPQDHNRGQVVWMNRDENGELQKHFLLMNVGRVADVQPGDFDGDGDLDLVVAEFGWRKTGSIHVMTQTGLKDGVPQFETEVIDKRHGTINVPVIDLNGDGHLDFIALVSQEYEQIDAFMNRGDGKFERQEIHKAGDPSWGSSWIQLVDMDGDGDQDIVYSNGDTLDSHYLKPYHGVQWLENIGDFPWRKHEVTKMPGVYRSVAGDVDGDGDVDIIAGAFIPKSRIIRDEDRGKEYDVLVWMERVEGGKFVRHSIEKRSEFGYMTVALDDFDEDGDLDILCGEYTSPDAEGTVKDWLQIYWNDGGSS